MKIIHISTGEQKIPAEMGGGIEGYILMLAKSMAQLGHSVTIIDRKYSMGDPNISYIDKVRIMRLDCYRFSSFSFYPRLAINQIIYAIKINHHLANVDYDILHVHSSIVGLFLSIINLEMRKRLYYTTHATRRTNEFGSSAGVIGSVSLLLENQLVRRARNTITLNDLVRENLLLTTGVQRTTIITLPVVIDTEKFRPGLDIGCIKKKFDLDGKFVSLFVGRIRVDKGIEYLVRAADIVVNKFCYRNTLFLLVGPTEEFGAGKGAQSPYQSKIIQLIKDFRLERNVNLTGPLSTDDLIKLYTACDIFILPSLTEAMPTAILEAMACSKAVIGTRVGGIPMQIRDNQNGLLIDPAAEMQLAEAIRYMIDNPEDRIMMGLCGRKMAEDEFSSDRIAYQLVEIYKNTAV